ncbi:ATP-binding protein [Bradyrhizobium sp. HKCCYLS2038]|uniref:ATP-binding protein n=1 Tax=Bradyrhizobium sp. HKCCYLS2038 TaxID=3420764 RepID=UPI003EBA5D6F
MADILPGTVRCTRCRASCKASARFCEECGLALFAGCSACGGELALGSRYCTSCGAAASTDAADLRAPAEQRKQKSTGAIEPVRKHVTVLFADLKGSTGLIAERDLEEGQQLLDGLLEQMIDAVHRFGGTANQVMGDGIMALFGAPVAHEDHALRACLAALAIHDSIRQDALESAGGAGLVPLVRIGLNSGEVVLRSIRSDVRLEYTAQGLVSHLAARMEQAAEPGTTLLTPATYALVQGFVRAKPRDNLPIKGLTEPLSGWQLLGTETDRSRLGASLAMWGRSRLVGRENELCRLREISLIASSGSGQIVALVGEAGVGKSRLTMELRQHNELSHWLVLVAQSASYAVRTAYFAFGSLLRQYLGIDKTDTAELACSKINAKLSILNCDRSKMISPLLSMLDLETGDEGWNALEADVRRRQTVEVVKQLLLAVSECQPLMLVFEDLHWLDAESERVIDALVDQLPTRKILLVLVYRPEHQHQWANRDHYSQFRVQPLDTYEANALLDGLIGDDASLDQLKHELVTRTGGNPFFLEEIVRSLIDRKKLVGVHRAYRLVDAFEQASIPGSVQAVLASRIDRLPAQLRQLLQVAAVIGQQVAPSLLEAVVEIPGSQLHSAMERLRQQELMYRIHTLSGPEYTFKHSLTHEVAYAELSQERRRNLHARVVEAIEQVHAGQTGQHVEDLSRHALQGQVWSKAVHYLGQAGAQAAKRSAHHQALDCFNKALSALQHLPRHRANLEKGIELHFAARNSLWPFSAHAQILHHLVEAEGLAKMIDDRRTLGRVASFMIQHHRMAGSPVQALECVERALTIARELGDFELEIDTSFRAALACLNLGVFRRSDEFLRRNVVALDSGVPYLRSGQPGHPAVLSRTWLAVCLSELGEFDDAITYGVQAIAIADGLKDPYSLVSALFGYGAALLCRHQIELAEQTLERASELCVQYELPVLRRLVSFELGQLKTIQGRSSEAIPLLEQAVNRGGSTANMARFALYLIRLGEAYLLAGRALDARTVCDQALDLSRQRSERGHEAWGLRLQAEINAHDSACHPAAALESYGMSLAIGDALGMRPLAALARLGRSRFLRRLGRSSEADEDLAAARRSFAELGMPVPEQRSDPDAAKSIVLI